MELRNVVTDPQQSQVYILQPYDSLIAWEGRKSRNSLRFDCKENAGFKAGKNRGPNTHPRTLDALEEGNVSLTNFSAGIAVRQA